VIEPSSPPRVAVVEPWLADSHAAFAEGLVRSMGLECAVVGLPAGSWQWRMRLASTRLAATLDALDPAPDVLLATDYVNLPALVAASRVAARTPILLYFHENQLTYPRRRGASGDPEFGAINVLSCLAATRCAFSSRHQREAFLDAALALLSHDDGADAAAAVAAIEERSDVLPPGFDPTSFDAARARRPGRRGRPLRIVWPHRFDHDKNPDDLFRTLAELVAEGLAFELAALGAPSIELPPAMDNGRAALGDRIVAWGHLEGDAYAEALATSDVVVSTAYQETHGLAVVEAIRAGCAPLLPRRLSYPEILGAHGDGRLYENRAHLKRMLRKMMRNPEAVRAATGGLWREMERFTWAAVGPRFRELLIRAAAERGADGGSPIRLRGAPDIVDVEP
jgi:glycosyltransferase involved in cell wall biosynthesis